MKLKRVLAFTLGKPVLEGADCQAVELALNAWAKGVHPLLPVDGKFTRRDADRLRAFQAEQGISPTHGQLGEGTLAKLEAFMTPAARRLYASFKPPKPQNPKWAGIGPVQPGGQSLLDMSLTHDTSDIPRFPAVDTAWGGGGGVTVIAPEACVVDTKDTSAGPGEAVYLTGVSTLRHWVGHLNRDWPIGKKFNKGDVIGKTLPIPGQSDHAHWGVNAEAILGKGKELLWGGAPSRPRKRYQLGSPTIREQLEKVLL